jgi:hypothetical protein
MRCLEMKTIYKPVKIEVTKDTKEHEEHNVVSVVVLRVLRDLFSQRRQRELLFKF